MTDFVPNVVGIVEWPFEKKKLRLYVVHQKEFHNHLNVMKRKNL